MPKIITKFNRNIEILHIFLYNEFEESKEKGSENMSELKLDLKNSGITQKNILEYREKVEKIHKELHKRKDDEKDFVRMARITRKL